MLVTRTVRDLIAGAGVEFVQAGSVEVAVLGTIDLLSVRQADERGCTQRDPDLRHHRRSAALTFATHRFAACHTRSERR